MLVAAKVISRSNDNSDYIRHLATLTQGIRGNKRLGFCGLQKSFRINNILRI